MAATDHRPRRAGNLFKTPLFEAGRDPKREWVEALRAAIVNARFAEFHDRLVLSDDDVQRCVNGDLCSAFSEKLAEPFLEWARRELRTGQEDAVGQEPSDFEPLVRQGWEAARHGGGAVTLGHAYCLFFREHLKRDPAVFRKVVANTLEDMRNKLDGLGTNLTGELQTLRDQVAQVAAAPPDLAAFERWLDPQLGALRDLLAGVKGQLDAVARGQRELACQQGEILVALTAIRTELARGHPQAAAAESVVLGYVARLTEAFQRVERKLFGLPLVRPSVPREPPASAGDLWIIEAKHRSLDLVGREAEMKALWDWLHSGEPISVRLMTGDAGAGKTRLAFELIWRLAIEEGDAWQAGRLSSDDLRLLIQDNYSATWDWDRPTLVVLDYARASHDALRRLLTELARRDHDANLRPFRLLLLERTPVGTQQWLEALFPLQSSDGGPLVRELFHPPQPVPLAPLVAAELRRGLFAATLQRVARFDGHLPLTVPETGENLEFDRMLAQPDWREPLTFMMAALVAYQKGNLLAGQGLKRADLALALADAETERVGKFAGRWLPAGEESLLRHVAAFATLAGGLGRDEAQRLADTEAGFLHVAWDARHRPLAEVLATAWPAADGGVAGLQPDIVAEAFVLRNLARRLSREQGVQAVRRLVKTHERACAGLILRAFHNFQSLPADAETLAAWAEALIAEGLASRDFVLLSALDDSMPVTSTALRRSAAKVTEARYQHLKAIAVPESAVELRAEFARVANNLGVCLSDAGRRAEALAPAQEAVDLDRTLARQNPDAFTPDLAGSLHNLANRLSELGRRAEALAPAQEAVDLDRTLARQNPDAFTPDLASSLGVFGLVLEGNDRRQEALASFAEGVRVLAASFESLPEAHAPVMGFLAQEYLRLAEASGQPPDEAMLAPVLATFQKLQAESPPAG